MDKRGMAWRVLGPAVAMAFACVGAIAQDAEAPNGTSPGEIAVPPPTDVVPEVRARAMGGPPAPGVRHSAVDVARSFYQADANHDGEITRDEARHLALMPYDFDLMDRDHDGIISRFEYEDAFQ
jgi:hypothetical protein